MSLYIHSTRKIILEHVQKLLYKQKLNEKRKNI
jgi:hypothetical protein